MIVAGPHRFARLLADIQHAITRHAIITDLYVRETATLETKPKSEDEGEAEEDEDALQSIYASRSVRALNGCRNAVLFDVRDLKKVCFRSYG